METQIPGSTAKETLVISEMFKSIQGEGHTTGIPCYFIRLTACNLCCGLSQENISKATKESWDQNKVKENMSKDATWVCDSTSVWLKGSKYSFPGIVNYFSEPTFITDLKDGCHIVFTGGEPCLQKEAIVAFLNYLEEKHRVRPTCEIETNGTILPTAELLARIKYWNISPKLSNSAMPKEKRINENFIKLLNIVDNGYNQVMFKFVVSDIENITEVITDFKIPFNIPYHKMRLMPGADNKEDLIAKEEWVVERCKELNIPYSSRLHIHIWDKMTGV